MGKRWTFANNKTREIFKRSLTCDVLTIAKNNKCRKSIVTRLNSLSTSVLLTSNQIQFHDSWTEIFQFKHCITRFQLWFEDSGLLIRQYIIRSGSEVGSPPRESIRLKCLGGDPLLLCDNSESEGRVSPVTDVPVNLLSSQTRAASRRCLLSCAMHTSANLTSGLIPLFKFSGIFCLFFPPVLKNGVLIFNIMGCVFFSFFFFFFIWSIYH